MKYFTLTCVLGHLLNNLTWCVLWHCKLRKWQNVKKQTKSILWHCKLRNTKVKKYLLLTLMFGVLWQTTPLFLLRYIMILVSVDPTVNLLQFPNLEPEISPTSHISTVSSNFLPNYYLPDNPNFLDFFFKLVFVQF